MVASAASRIEFVTEPQAWVEVKNLFLFGTFAIWQYFSQFADFSFHFLLPLLMGDLARDFIISGKLIMITVIVFMIWVPV